MVRKKAVGNGRQRRNQTENSVSSDAEHNVVAFLDLAKLANQSYEHRRGLEWKVNIGIWTILVAAAGLITIHHPSTPVAFDCIATGCLTTLVVAHLYWLYSMHLRNEFDVETMRFYRQKINVKLGINADFMNTVDRRRDQYISGLFDDYFSVRASVTVSVLLAVIDVVLLHTATAG